MTTKKEQYANHLIINGKRTRRVLFSPYYVPLQVLCVRKSPEPTYVDHPTTYQVVDDAMWELSCTAGDNGIIRITQVGEGEFERIDLDRVNPNITDWLRDVDYLTHQNFLPAGCGWDGMYSLVERKKLEKLKYVLGLGKSRYTIKSCSREHLERIAMLATLTSGSRVCDIWKDCEKYRWGGYLTLHEVAHRDHTDANESLVVFGVDSEEGISIINPSIRKLDDGRYVREYDDAEMMAKGFNRFIVVTAPQDFRTSQFLVSFRLIMFR